MRRTLFLFAVAAFAAGCGVPTPAAPTAQDVLAKPQKSDLKDAHFTVTGKITDNGTTVELVGDGALVYKPKVAGRFKFTTNVGGQAVVVQEISLDGTNYGMTPASPKWIATKDPAGIDPNAFAGASDQKYVGEENLPQGKVWHAAAKDRGGNAFDAYIREKDGYPIKYVETQSGGQNITLTFDNYNTGEQITAPPADQVTQG
jgi:outer membrane lipoprotein-sorting protein